MSDDDAFEAIRRAQQDLLRYGIAIASLVISQEAFCTMVQSEKSLHLMWLNPSGRGDDKVCGIPFRKGEVRP